MIERLPNIRHLAALAATVEHGTVTEAAKSVNLTQSALTQAIAKLEKALDCKLFRREPDGMKPTEPALLLAERANAALEMIGSRRVTSTQMRAYIALARTGSYSAAAQLVGVSPASLHRAVADLSLALGERLVERRGRYLALTNRGAIRARNFSLAQAELRNGLSELSAWMGQAGGRVVIGAMPLSRARWLPQAIVEFGKRQPQVEIAVLEGSYAELAGPLRDGEIDLLLGALRLDESSDDLAQEKSFTDHPQIVMRAGHPLDAKRRPSLCALRKYPWALPSRNTPLRRYWEEMIGDDGGPQPHVSIECGSVLTIRELLLETDMLSLLSPDQLRVEIEGGLIATAAPPSEVSRTIGITTRRDWRPTAPQRAVHALLRNLATKYS
jgi:DNA-binding transcriptional LysR family regulator